jgi:hypothetical protein
MARPRRLSSKTKESTIKSTTNNTLPVIQKSSPPHSNPSDQQRQTVNSNKGQRKGTTPRRETTDEPQTTQKIVKSSSINSGKYRVLYIMVVCYALLSVFHFLLLLFDVILQKIQSYHRHQHAEIVLFLMTHHSRIIMQNGIPHIFHRFYQFLF